MIVFSVWPFLFFSVVFGTNLCPFILQSQCKGTISNFSFRCSTSQEGAREPGMAWIRTECREAQPEPELVHNKHSQIRRHSNLTKPFAELSEICFATRSSTETINILSLSCFSVLFRLWFYAFLSHSSGCKEK